MTAGEDLVLESTFLDLLEIREARETRRRRKVVRTEFIGDDEGIRCETE